MAVRMESSRFYAYNSTIVGLVNIHQLESAVSHFQDLMHQFHGQLPENMNISNKLPKQFQVFFSYGGEYFGGVYEKRDKKYEITAVEKYETARDMLQYVRALQGIWNLQSALVCDGVVSRLLS